MNINLLSKEVKYLEKTLKDLKKGQTAIIKRINGKGGVRRRLMDMGVTKGEKVFVRKVAPLGDPIEVNLRGYELTFRKEEAERIIIEG